MRRAPARASARRRRSTFTGGDGHAARALRAKADRIDLLEDGTLRVDRLQARPRAEDGARAAAADLRRLRRAARSQGAARPRRGRSRAPATSRSRRRTPFVALGGSTSLEGARSKRAAERLVAAVDGIERGEFPVEPDEPFLLHVVRVRRRLPQGLRRRRVSDRPSPVAAVALRRGSRRRRPTRAADDRGSRLGAPIPTPTRAQFAVDPANNVVLEASAGTGKTSVLVARYVNLLTARRRSRRTSWRSPSRARPRPRCASASSASCGARRRGPRSIARAGSSCAIASATSPSAPSTRSACRCCASSRSRPTSIPASTWPTRPRCRGSIEEALDQSLRILIGAGAAPSPTSRSSSRSSASSRTREGLASLLERRLVAWAGARSLPRAGARAISTAEARLPRAPSTALRDRARRRRRRASTRFLADGPVDASALSAARRGICGGCELRRRAATRRSAAVLDRVAAHFLTARRQAADERRRSSPTRAQHYPVARRGEAPSRRGARARAGRSQTCVSAFSRDLNVVLARGIRRMFAVALAQYRAGARRALGARLLRRARARVELLRPMDEFSQSRFRLESRYHHVLVDEFQDTSRAQWELVSLLVQSWGEGLGLATQPVDLHRRRPQAVDLPVPRRRGRPSCRRRRGYIDALRPAGEPAALDRAQLPRRAGAARVRQRPLRARWRDPDAAAPDASPTRDDDRFPVDGRRRQRPTPDDGAAGASALGVVAGDDADGVRGGGRRRDRADPARGHASATGKTGVAAPAQRRATSAILFRSRASHREFERALERRGIPAYVYKGLGLLRRRRDQGCRSRSCASSPNPASDLRAAAFLRSRFVRLSDRGAGGAGAAAGRGAHRRASRRDGASRARRRGPAACSTSRGGRARLARAGRSRAAGRAVRARSLPRRAYAYELRGPRRQQAWENVKKMRGLVRRIQNRGYATLPRIADHLDSLTAGDESNAVLEALDAVNLMTVHASKGLEFPIVFVVNLAKGASGPPRPVRVIVDGRRGRASRCRSGRSSPRWTRRSASARSTKRKRLLYVALTRARDRLYLSSALKDGVMVPGRGSLGEVLPPVDQGALCASRRRVRRGRQLGRSPGRAPSGAEFEWRVCSGSRAAKVAPS